MIKFVLHFIYNELEHKYISLLCFGNILLLLELNGNPNL